MMPIIHFIHCFGYPKSVPITTSTTPSYYAHIMIVRMAAFCFIPYSHACTMVRLPCTCALALECSYCNQGHGEWTELVRGE